MSAVLITGGHGGLGFACCKYLAQHSGREIILAGRSMAKMEEAAQELRRDGATVTLLELDTSSLASVRAAAARCRTMIKNKEVTSLDAILCNAGGRFGKLSYSVDGYEITFATNCLGHFLLVTLLIDLVNNNGRVIFTASGTHDPDTMDGKMVGAVVEPDAFALAHDGKHGKKPTPAGKRYSTSKLCNVLEGYELARRLKASGSSIVSIVFDPGSTPGTGFLREMPKPVRWLSTTKFFESLARRLGVTIGSLDFSGACLAKLAIDPQFEGGSGKYYQSSDGKLIEQRSSTLSYDETRARKLWDDMAKLADSKESGSSKKLK